MTKTSSERANVLLVDDKHENLLALESVLADLDQNLVRAASAREALRFLLLEDVALILLDVEMPGVNGFELAELIRERQRTQHTPIIFISATSTNQQYIFKGYSLGAVDYLTKPIDPEILKSKVRFFSRLFLQNQEIKRQAELLEQANSRLDHLNATLEQGVQERTEQLRAANKDLENEIAIRRESEARLATEHAITRALANADSFETAVPLILRAFCEHLKAGVSTMWRLNVAGTELECIHVETLNSAIPGTDTFIDETWKRTFRVGSGLPGTAWQSNEPVCFPNTLSSDVYHRGPYAATAGLHSAIAFPVWVGTHLYGVIEFVTRYPLQIDGSLRNMLEAIGSEIGQFIQRKRAERDREELLLREKALREKAEAASRLKDEFLATVSHELRTPLNSILGWSQIVLRESVGPEERKTGLETIYRNARSQAQLIDDLLDTSRLITGNLVLNLGPTDVIPVVEAAIDVVRPASAAKEITISADYPAETTTLTCDSHRLQQMVWNLLTNAVKFTPKGGRIDVKVDNADENLMIAVADSGSGISPEFLPFVFDRFRQQDSTSTRKHEGLGLGLSIVRSLAELHGGSVSVESDGLDKGSTFTLTLPLSRIAQSPEMVDDEPAGNTGVSRSAGVLDGVRVMVVDDDEDACNMLRFALGLAGADVTTSPSAADAIEKIPAQKPDILLTDINMPGEDGYSLLKRLRSLEQDVLANIPVIALTAMARPEDNERVLAAGFQMHVAKPIEVEELSESISQLIRQCREGKASRETVN